MHRIPRSLAAWGGLLVGWLATTNPGQINAAPPTVDEVSPLGGCKGSVTALTFQGSHLEGQPRLVAPFRFTTEGGEGKNTTPARWTTRLTIDQATPLGVYPVRVQTDDGLSAPFLLAVGQLPTTPEKEENSSFETAQAFALPAVLEGRVSGNDVDYFRFKGKKGQRVVVDAQCARIGSGVDPSIRLTLASRSFVASADDTLGLLTDARLVATLPADADYVVEISDSRYQASGRAFYRLIVGELPLVEEIYPIGGRRGETVGLELRGAPIEGLLVGASTLSPAPGLAEANVRLASDARRPDGGVYEYESLPLLVVGDLTEVREPSDPAASPLRATFPVALNGRIDPEGDEDRFVLAVVPGQKLRIAVDAADHGSALDGVLQVLGPQGNVLTTADDTTRPAAVKTTPPQTLVSPDPSLDFTVPAGLYEVTLALRDLESRGGVGYPYRITVIQATPGFELVLNDAQVSVPNGGTAAVGVTVVRGGYNGPIALTVANPPAGLNVRPGTIPDGQALGAFTVSATGDAAFPALVLDVTGEGREPAGPFVRHARKTLVFAQQGIYPTKTVHQIGLASATARALPVTLDSPASAFEVAHGFGTSVSVKATRGEGGAGALAIAAQALPPGLSVAEAKLDDKAVDAAVAVNTTVDHPLGPVSLVLVAKGKVGGVDLSIAVPAVTLNVVRPASVELAAPGVESRAGAGAEVKGRVIRRGGFKEPVTVKLNGLPAGATATPLTVAPGETEFVLKIVVDAKAAPATAAANVALAFQVNKKDYPSPSVPLSVKVLAAK